MIYEFVTGRLQFIYTLYLYRPDRFYRNSGFQPNSGPVDEMENSNSVRVPRRFDRILLYWLTNVIPVLSLELLLIYLVLGWGLMCVWVSLDGTNPRIQVPLSTKKGSWNTLLDVFWHTWYSHHVYQVRSVMTKSRGFLPLVQNDNLYPHHFGNEPNGLSSLLNAITYSSRCLLTYKILTYHVYQVWWGLF